ncbi:MAG: aldo/keto reductase [Candidatus Hydrogenedentes bacterium]|nr:aldo/keto reductase [Candidatus Hydrogenedentota bacterium]
MLIPGIALTPSRICLGTASFGAEVSEEASFAVLDAYAGAGGNYLDTAHIYGAWIPGRDGASERLLGRWLRTQPSRGRFIVATKGGCPPMSDLSAPGRCGYEELRRDLHESLERLQLDSVDLYWLHRDNEQMSVGAIVDSMTRLLEEGHFRTYGFSNWQPSRIQAALDYARAQHLPAPVASQIGYACARYPRPEPPLPGMRYANAEDLAWHRAGGFPLVAYTAQAGGWFGAANVDWAQGGFCGDAPHGALFDSAENRRRLLACIGVAEAHSCSASQIALAWLLRRPNPVTPIIGTGNAARATEAMGAAGLMLTQEELDHVARE